MGKYDNVVQLPCSPHCTGRVEDGKVVEVIGCWGADLVTQSVSGFRGETKKAGDLQGLCVRERLERGETVMIPTSATGSTTG